MYLFMCLLLTAGLVYGDVDPEADVPTEGITGVKDDYNQDRENVKDLICANNDSSNTVILWSTQNETLKNSPSFVVQCRCLRRLAPGCNQDCKAQVQVYFVSEFKTVFDNLYPYSEYEVAVGLGNTNPGVKMLFNTSEALPTEVVTSSAGKAFIEATKATISWEPVMLCSGVLKGYVCQLLDANNKAFVLSEGFTVENNVTFSDLSPNADYIAKIYIENGRGWNPNAYLQIKLNVDTSGVIVLAGMSRFSTVKSSATSLRHTYIEISVLSLFLVCIVYIIFS